MKKSPDSSPPRPKGKKKPSFFRGNLLIFPKFQLMLLGVNIGIMILVSLITWIQMRSAIGELEMAGGTLGQDANFFKQVLNYSTSALQSTVIGSLLLGVALAAGITLIVSHRFAGPMVRMRAYFSALAEGQYPPEKLRFRKGDFLADLPPLVNKALENVITKASEK